tara:strand:+ start:263 stop:814 length:552 start_codon:yes stop_codon:yes gene_type:complete
MIKAIYFSVTALILLISGSVSANTSSETVLGDVISVIERTREVIRQTPLTERVCEDKDVPVYGSNGQQKNDLGSMIIGGIIGSAIGNKMSDSEGAGAAGTVAGAIIGKATSDESNKKNQEIVGYNRTRSCENVKTVTQQTIQEVIGYRLTINVDGKFIDIDTQTKYLPGSQITVTKTVNYSVQ